MANAVGIVKQVSGTVVAIDVQGNQRVLRVGDEIMLGEVVHTEGSDSSVVVSMNNGKEFTLLGDDTIKIDQSVAQVESFGAEAFADASALQQAILAGDDLSKLEETAAGGAGGGGGSTGGGVSLAAGVFETGGHESNISANYNNLSGLDRAVDAIYNNVGGINGGTNPNPSNPQVPDNTNVTVTMDANAGEAIEGNADHKYLVYNVELDSARNTFNLDVDVAGGTPGSDYDRNLKYSLDGGRTWQSLINGKIEANGLATPIKDIKVRIEALDDDGRIPGNQNEGVKTGNIGEEFGSPDYGIYKEGITLKVTASNGASSAATGQIIDNDDILTANKFLDGKHINTKDGEDTITINNGARNSTIDAGTNSDKIIMNNDTTIERTNIIAGEGDDRVDINTGVKFENSTIDAGVGNDTINVNTGANVNKSKVYTGEGEDRVDLKQGSTTTDSEIYTQNGDDIVNIEGKFVSETKKAKVETGSGNDVINVSGEVIGNMSIGGEGQVELNTDSGNDTVNITTGSKVSYTSIDTGWGNDTFNVIGDKNDIDSTILKNVNVNLEKGADNVKIENATLHNVAIDTNDNSVDGKTVVNIGNSHLDRTKIYTGDDNDTINIRNTVINDNYEGPDDWGSIIRGEGGDDIVNIESSTISGKRAEIDTDNYRGGHPESGGNDTLNIKDTTIDRIRFIKTGGGDDTVHVKNSTISNIDDIDGLTGVNLGKGNDTMTLDGGTKIINTNIGMGAGDDTINIESGTILDRTTISGGTGDDTFKLGKGIDLSNNVKLDGGAGDDTLQISENIDFSRVSKFENLKLGENNESVNLNLDIKDVLNITDNKDTILKIEGDSSDHLSLKGFNNNIVSSHDGYDRYQGVDAQGNTTYIDIKHEVTVDFQ